MLLKSKRMKIISLCVVSSLLSCIGLTGAIVCIVNDNKKQNRNYVCKEEEKIYIIGETHGKKELYQKEMKKWKAFYEDNSYRHLFVELPYYGAEILNIWMKEDNNDRLDFFYDSLEGTLSHVPSYKDFLMDIKTNCPETIFHGTDVGHLFDPLGNYYIEYLKTNNMENSEQYKYTMDAYSQYIAYREDNHPDGKSPVRENYMISNFKREYNSLPKGTKIMGIYGSYHSDPRNETLMAGQLKEAYGDCITYHYASYVK